MSKNNVRSRAKPNVVKPRPAPKGADLSYISPGLRANAVYIEDLEFDPVNPRRGDVPMVAQSLHHFGQQKTITIYLFPGSEKYRIITGNHTTRAALYELKDSKGNIIKKPWKFIAANIFEGTPEQAQAFALMDNRSSDVAQYDDETLGRLLKDAAASFGEDDLGELTGYSKEDLQYLLQREDLILDDEEELGEGEEENENGEEDELFDYDENDYAKEAEKVGLYISVHDINPLSVFPSDNPYQIPALRPDMLAEPPDLPIKTWPGSRFADKEWEKEGYWWVTWGYDSKTVNFERAYINFYADDPSLWPIWANPDKYAERFIKLKVRAVTTVDFSIYWDRPFPERLWSMYCRMWTGRFFQELGLKVIPGPSAPVLEKDLRFQCAGIPKNPPCISIQFQSGTKSKDDRELIIRRYKQGIQNLLKELDPGSMIVYATKAGHEALWNIFPSQLHVIRLPTAQDVRRYKYEPDQLRSDKKTYKKKRRTKNG